MEKNLPNPAHLGSYTKNVIVEGIEVPDFVLEKSLGASSCGTKGTIVIGVDEAGRGPLAGPVVAAAVHFIPNRLKPHLASLNDSKYLPKALRESLFDLITQNCSFAVGESSVEEIERINILEASLLAMARAVGGLTLRPDIALIDGNKPPQLACRAQCVVKGDSKSLSIAAASVLAKVSRDRIMARLAEDFPNYGWDHNQGYGTAEHLKAIQAFGITPWHRKTFRPISELLLITS